jgi:hypothetical protein
MDVAHLNLICDFVRYGKNMERIIQRAMARSSAGTPRHRDAHGPGRAPNAWSRVGEKEEGEGDGEVGNSTQIVLGGVVLGVTVVTVAVMVWSRAKKGGG